VFEGHRFQVGGIGGRGGGGCRCLLLGFVSHRGLPGAYWDWGEPVSL